MPHYIYDQVDEHDHQDQYHIDAVSIITATINNTNVFRVEVLHNNTTTSCPIIGGHIYMPLYSIGPKCLYIIHEKVEIWSGVTDPLRIQTDNKTGWL